MKCISAKLRETRGASIMLALLLFLICAMVSASVVAAAASNAGKTRSARVEQQKQLTLASALELVSGELKKAKYTGAYTLYTWTQKTPRLDADGNPVLDNAHQQVYDYQPYFCYVQGEGTYIPPSGMQLLNLREELDRAFGRQFTQPGCVRTYSEGAAIPPHTLIVTLPDGVYKLAGYPYPADPAAPKPYEVPAAVSVEVAFSPDTQHIALTAWLGTGAKADATDVMRAELVAVKKPKFTYAPEGRKPETTLPVFTQPDILEQTVTPSVTNALTWELNWIRKGANG